MEDLVPLLIFIVIAVINILKYQTEKKGKGKPAPARPKQGRPQHPPSPLEEFFEEITRKFEPKPPPQPDGSELYEQPDSLPAAEAFKPVPTGINEQERIASMPPPSAPISEVIATSGASPAPPAAGRRSSTLRLPVDASVFSSMGNMRMSTPPLLRSATGTTDFAIGNRRQLKQAILAGLVFGQPRAYDTSFDNTVAK